MFTLPIATATPFAQPFQAQHQAAVNEYAAKNTIASIPRGAAGDSSMLLNYGSNMTLADWAKLRTNLAQNRDSENLKMREEGIDPENEAQLWPVAQGLAVAEGLSSIGNSAKITRSTPGGRVGYMHLDRESARMWLSQLENQTRSPHAWMRPSSAEINEVRSYIKDAFSGNQNASHARALAFWVKQKARLAKAYTGTIDPKGVPTIIEIKPKMNLSTIASEHGIRVNDIKKPDGSSFSDEEKKLLKVGQKIVIPARTFRNPTAHEIRQASAGGAAGTFEADPKNPKAEYNIKAEAVQKEVNRRAKEEISKSK